MQGQYPLTQLDRSSLLMAAMIGSRVVRMDDEIRFGDPQAPSFALGKHGFGLTDAITVYATSSGWLLSEPASRRNADCSGG
jgi:hypothetical protein